MIVGSHPVLSASQTVVSLNKSSVDIQLADWLEDNSISPRALADFSTILKPYNSFTLTDRRTIKSLNITVSV
jgi:hypothetical protein